MHAEKYKKIEAHRNTIADQNLLEELGQFTFVIANRLNTADSGIIIYQVMAIQYIKTNSVIAQTVCRREQLPS